MSLQWSAQGIHLVKDIKRSILKKKILMSFVIDSNSWYDKVFRYLHLILGIAAVVIGAVNQSLGSNSSTSPILTGIVVVMIKMKDYLKFEKIKDVAKRQTVKYEQLYQRIDREMLKPDDKRQLLDDFITLINREFNSISMEDPNISRSSRDKYINLCKANGIQYDEDLEALQELIKDKQAKPDNEEKVQPTVRPRSTSDEAECAEFKEKMKTVDTQQDLQWAIERLETLDGQV